jgi:hypothetical protein
VPRATILQGDDEIQVEEFSFQTWSEGGLRAWGGSFAKPSPHPPALEEAVLTLPSGKTGNILVNQEKNGWFTFRGTGPPPS